MRDRVPVEVEGPRPTPDPCPGTRDEGAGQLPPDLSPPPALMIFADSANLSNMSRFIAGLLPLSAVTDVAFDRLSLTVPVVFVRVSSAA
jgi:hypothetical protein